MFERVLKRMRERVRTRQYVVSVHAEEEMDDAAKRLGEVLQAMASAPVDRSESAES